MAKKAQLPLTTVKEQFGAWQVPSEAHFKSLINIAALSLKPGVGLSGGDPSTEAGKVDTGRVTPLTVHSHNGMEVTQRGLSVKPDPAGGLAVNTQGLNVRASDSVVSDAQGLCLKVNNSAALKVENGGIAVQINTKAGLNEATGISLHVDGKTVEMDENGALRVKCDPTGGLTADQGGHLGVDLDIILRRPCIRAYQGWAYAYIPKSMIGVNDQVFLYIHDRYVGEMNHSGASYYVQRKDSDKAKEYWIVSLNQWVTEKDVLRARLIKKGQDEATGTDIARYTVTPAGSAPVTIPRITEVSIVDKSGKSLTQVKAGDTIQAKSITAASDLIYSWKLMNTQTNAWNSIGNNSNAEFTVPINAASGDQFCVFLELKGGNGPFAFSRTVTVSKT